VVVGKLGEEVSDGLLFLVSFPFFKIRLKSSLEEEGHRAEAGSFEVEVKIHVIFLGLALLGLRNQLCIGFGLLHLSRGLTLLLLLQGVSRGAGLGRSFCFFLQLTLKLILDFYLLLERSPL
jgi:hypothetical protein